MSQIQGEDVKALFDVLRELCGDSVADVIATLEIMLATAVLTGLKHRSKDVAVLKQQQEAAIVAYNEVTMLLAHEFNQQQDESPFSDN